jgi:hypothetical protein
MGGYANQDVLVESGKVVSPVKHAISLPTQNARARALRRDPRPAPAYDGGPLCADGGG